MFDLTQASVTKAGNAQRAEWRQKCRQTLATCLSKLSLLLSTGVRLNHRSDSTLRIVDYALNCSFIELLHAARPSKHNCVQISGLQGDKVVARAIVIVERHPCVPSSLLPLVGVCESLLHCVPGKVKALAECLDGDVKGLALRIELLYLVLQILDVLSCALKDSTLILLSSWNDFRNVFDTFVNNFTASIPSLITSRRRRSTIRLSTGRMLRHEVYYIPSLWFSLRCVCH